MTNATAGRQTRSPIFAIRGDHDLSFVICHLSWRFAQVRQLSPIAAGVDPDGAIGTKGDYLAGCQRGDLLDLAGSERWG
jgi:hypothetical protein